jgi:hypothetical protein
MNLLGSSDYPVLGKLSSIQRRRSLVWPLPTQLNDVSQQFIDALRRNISLMAQGETQKVTLFNVNTPIIWHPHETGGGMKGNSLSRRIKFVFIRKTDVVRKLMGDQPSKIITYRYHAGWTIRNRRCESSSLLQCIRD